MRGQFKIDSLDVLLKCIRPSRHPVTIAVRQSYVHLSRSFPGIRLEFDLSIKVS